MRSPIVPITEARTKIYDLVEGLNEQGHVTLVRHSRPVAILMTPTRYEALLDQIEHLEAQAAILYGQLHPEESISHEKLKAELGLMT